MTDKYKHALMGFVVSFLFGLWTTIVVSVVVELTQAESGNATREQFIKKIASNDTMLDLAADGIGMVLGLTLRYLVCKSIL